MQTQFTRDDRGVSEVIGAILVFGLLIALLAIIQTQAIPAANQQVEFDHSHEAQGDLTRFHERASRVAAHGTSESLSVKAGTGYPNRMLFFNPPRATGTISTSDPGTAEISNVTATDPEVADYLNGSHTVQIDSKALEYKVEYNEYQNAPTTRYEYGILYDQHRNSTIVQNSGTVIDDTNINLLFMTGNYSKSSGSAQSVDIEPVSAPARPVTVTGSGNNDIVLTLPTELPVAKWEEYYEDQSHVNISSGPGDSVVITLDGDRTYTLRMAGLGLEQGVEKPGAHYIVPVDDGVTTIGAGDNATVKYEVRDKYNNPVSGVNVTIDGVTKQTDGDGRVTKRVSPGNPTQVTGQIIGCAADRCKADFQVEVTDLNPNPSSGVRLVEADDEPYLLGLISSANAGMQFESASGNRSIDQIRFNHYHPDPSDHSPVTMSDGSTQFDAEIGGAFVDVPDSFAEITTSGTRYDLEFQSTTDNSHYWIVTIIFEDGGRALYFASPQT